MHDARTPSDDDERDELLDTIATLLLDSIEKDVPKPERADVVARRVWLDGFRWRPRRLHSGCQSARGGRGRRRACTQRPGDLRARHVT
jgi:hypothetical protein